MIPLALVAGFFGAGKTWFLSELIPELHTRGLRAQVLLNDFESAEIDATRLTTMSSIVTPLSGECVCCTSLESLMDTLNTMPALPNSVTLIEANGATKTEELLSWLTTARGQARYTLPLQTTIVDAKRWQKRWWHNELEVNQTRTATHVYVNWTDRVRAERIALVESGIRTLNPHAVFASPAAFADELQRLAVDTASERERQPVLMPRSHAHQEHEHHEHEHREHTHHAHTHEHQFASVAFGLPEVVSRDAFMVFVRTLPREVVRAKGLVRFADRPDEMFVWNRVDGRKVVSLDRSVPHGAAQPVAVFIGVGMPSEALRVGVESLSPSDDSMRSSE
ncbi:MAG TPA: GTP-binding protein [Gemmatimonadaceae bacterium]|jgi:G3E family GTPase